MLRRMPMITAAVLSWVILPGSIHAAPPPEAEAAAKALLRPVCADPKGRETFVAQVMEKGDEYEKRSAKWEIDITCEQIDLPVTPVNDTADPADEATHTDWIYDARWSPDGKTIVTAGRDKTIRFWDVATGKTIRKIDMASLPAARPATGQSMVRSARYLDSASIVATADGHPVRIFDTATGQPVAEIPYVHPDPKWDMPPFIETTGTGLVILGGYGGDIVAYDVKAKSERYRRPGTPNDYPFFATCAAAKLLAIARPGEEGFVRMEVVDLETGAPVWSFNAETGSHHMTASSVAFSRDGKLLGVDVQGWILIYDVPAKKLLTRIPAHPYFAGRNLTFTADGKSVIGGVTHAMLTDIATGKRVRHFGPFSDNFHSADVSPDGKHLVTGHLGSDGRIWEIATGTFVRRLGKDVKPPR